MGHFPCRKLLVYQVGYVQRVVENSSTYLSIHEDHIRTLLHRHGSQLDSRKSYKQNRLCKTANYYYNVSRVSIFDKSILAFIWIWG